MPAAVFPWPWTVAATSRPRADREPTAESNAAREDESERVETLYLRIEPALTNVVYRWLWNRDEVRDVIQEAFVRLWQMRERVDWERAEPLVYRIALNLAAKRRRSRRIWRWVGLETEPAVADEDPDREEAEAVRRAIDRLPEPLRRVIVLQIHAELSQVEIAAVLDIPVGTVGSRRNAAVARLRAALSKWEARR